jgi:hypothetical protein
MRRVKSARRLEPNVHIQPRGTRSQPSHLRTNSTTSSSSLNKRRSLLKDRDPAWDLCLTCHQAVTRFRR